MEQETLAIVAEVWRYPVKSMRGERLGAGRLGAGGLEGDRAWALLDRERRWASAKTDRGPWHLVDGMLDLHAGTDEDGVLVTLPDGRTARPGAAGADALLSAHLGEPLRFTAGAPGGRAQVWGRHHDAAPVHVVSDATLAALAPAAEDASADAEPDALDARRLRANLVLRTPEGTPPGYPEEAWAGRRVRVGGAVLRVLKPTERCVMTTRPQADEVVADRRVLQRIGRRNAACAGVYLDVVRPGAVAEGDAVLALD